MSQAWLTPMMANVYKGAALQAAMSLVAIITDLRRNQILHQVLRFRCFDHVPSCTRDVVETFGART